jgi:hypothetical protein
MNLIALNFQTAVFVGVLLKLLQVFKVSFWIRITICDFILITKQHPYLFRSGIVHPAKHVVVSRVVIGVVPQREISAFRFRFLSLLLVCSDLCYLVALCPCFGKPLFHFYYGRNYTIDSDCI